MGISIQGVTLAEVTTLTNAQDEREVIFKWDAVNNLYKATAGTWAKVTGGTIGDRLGNVATQAVDDRIGIGTFFIPETGIYELIAVGHDTEFSGISHIDLNGSIVGTIDWYDNVGTSNTQHTVSLGNLTKGSYRLALSMSSKNVSASHHRLVLQTLLIVKTV